MNRPEWCGRFCHWLIEHFIEVFAVTTGLIMLMGLFLMINGVSNMSNEIADLRVVSKDAERKAETATTVQDALLESSKLNRQMWEVFAQNNPNLPVPKVVTPTPTSTPRLEPYAPGIIITTPSPIPKPTPIIKYRTKIKRVAEPTPKPFWWYFRARPTPKPSR